MLWFDIACGYPDMPDTNTAQMYLFEKLINIGKYFIADCLKKYEIEGNLFPPNNPGWYQYLFNKLLTSTDEIFLNNKILY